MFFVVVASLAGLIFACTTPPGFGVDERAHFMRAYLVSEGDFFPEQIGHDHHIGAYLPVNLLQFVGDSTNNLLHDSKSDAFVTNEHADDTTLYTRYFHQRLSAVKVDNVPTDTQLLAAQQYSPAGYVPDALAAAVADHIGLPMLYSMYLERIATLLVYVLIVYAAIRLLPRFQWLLTTVALLPTAIFQASSVSIDPYVNALSFLLFALAIKLWYASPQHDKPRPPMRIREGIFVAGAIAGLALTKAPYTLLLLLFLPLPSDRFTSTRSAYRWKIIWIATGLLLVGAWQVINGDVTPSLPLMAGLPTNNIHLQVQYVVHHPFHFLLTLLRTYLVQLDTMTAQLLGTVGNIQVGLPNLVVCVLFAISVIFSFVSHPNDYHFTRRAGLLFDGSLVVTSLAIILLASAAMYAGYTAVGAPVISGIQGRYFIPILPLIVVWCYRIIPFTLVSDRELGLKLARISTTTLLALTIVVYYLANYHS